MSYRVDIPTLSANEVYTLTFEYEGTETIQLIVGDLTLETTDRRVVFTTTSPVNYIESNVNLTNLNMYEGYYESDDFCGEYTQESYIEGRSLVNYKRRVDYDTLTNNANIQETFTDDGYINYKQLGTGATGRGFRGNGFVSGIDQNKNYTIILRVRKNTFPADVFVPFTLSHKDEGVKFDEAVKGSYRGISYDISGGRTGVWKAVVKVKEYNVLLSARYWGSLHSLYVDENSEVTDLTQRTDIVGCEIEYAIEVLQGDYFDIDTGIDEHFEGIGCVKSPKIVSRNEDGTEESIISTPDDLELYELDGIFDKLDLTNGIVTKYIGNNNGNLYLLDTPTIEQLSLNPLKSYRNGSIQTSSQHLTPTLKTTLPISNKFTTTNLTSGSTYNVYFDGTATKLDAGGTVITNPVSPCEVECGGTTLTIEGTDIQNVRVIETTVKNEVGSVCGTTDVELSKVATKCGIHNIFDDYFQGSHNTSWAKDYKCISTRDDTTVKIVGNNSLNYAGYSLVDSLPFGTYKLHYKVKVSTIGDKYKVALSSNPNEQPQDAYVPVTDVTSTALVEEQTFVFYKKHITNMLFYTYYKGQEIEYYDISLIKLSDEDITGTDTSSINYSQTISKLEQPIKLISLGTTYDRYNPITGELVKRIGVSETDGSYSVLSSPVVENISMGKTIENIFNFEEEWINRGLNTSNAWKLTNDGDGIYTLKALQANATARVWFSLLDAEQTVGEELTTIIEVFKNTSNKSIPYWSQIRPEDGTGTDFTFNAGETGVKIQYGKFTATGRAIDFQNIGKDSEFQFRVTIVRGLYPNIKEGFGTRKIIQVPPHLYTNGQVKVYSDSEVYPTTILNGQSTNNYEVNELKTSNNYTIRYDGTCESINLANKSNTQGNNVLVKAGATSGNLTFVNDSGDIDNVLLVENDVREQEINHFTGLQTVEVSQLLVSSKQNLFEAYMKNDFEFLNNVAWGAQTYGSLHNGVFKCGNLSAGSNLQWAWNLIRPRVSGNDYVAKESKEDNPIVLANKVYNISFNISIVDHHTVDENHNYTIRAYDFDGNEVSVQKATGGQASLGINSNGVTNPTPTKFINLDVIFSKDIYCFALHASYGGQWAFDCTITDFTICEPENAKPEVPLIYEYIDLPQPVQINSLLDGTHDTYNPITGEYVQNVGYLKASDATIEYRSNTTTHIFAIKNSTITNPPILTSSWATYLESSVLPRVYNETVFGITKNNLYWYI